MTGQRVVAKHWAETSQYLAAVSLYWEMISKLYGMTLKLLEAFLGFAKGFQRVGRCPANFHPCPKMSKKTLLHLKKRFLNLKE
jgi:hypothetical protein